MAALDNVVGMLNPHSPFGPIDLFDRDKGAPFSANLVAEPEAKGFFFDKIRESALVLVFQ
jgi:hypothetical protein